MSASSPSHDDIGLPVMVGVSVAGSASAIRFGAAEALRAGCTLHLVHVVDRERGPDQRQRRLDPATAPLRAEQVLSEAVERARQLVDGQLDVTSELVHGALVEGLVDVSRDARLVVLQLRGPGTRSTNPRSTSARLMSRSPAPVVCVPGDWDGLGRGTVTVGVDDPLTCAPLLHEALLSARSRGARLRVVHVEWPLNERDADREILGAMAEAAVDLRDVAVGYQFVEAGVPSTVLIEAMETSELLVVGRHHPLVPRGSRLGSVARRVVREASCPVLLPTPSASISSARWDLEERFA